MSRLSNQPSIPISDPWISRFYDSQLLKQSDGPAGSDTLNTRDQEVYGPADQPISFRIGNGGAGYTGVIRSLVELYIAQHGGDFRIGWVTNHSRHSQIALLADVVQVALTYEPENEALASEEGWSKKVGRVFNDHFVLVGPEIELGEKGIGNALREMAKAGSNGRKIVFHTRGDGSATFAKEQALWRGAGVDVSNADWIETYPLSPYGALVKAEDDAAFLLTDRATFLTAKKDGRIPSLRLHVEGGEALLNPCSALVKSATFLDADGVDRKANEAAVQFALWLAGSEAQDIVRDYGRHWPLGKPLFTVADEDEFRAEHALALAS